MKKPGSTKKLLGIFEISFFVFKMWLLRGRRKSSQKLAKRRAFVWEWWGLDRLCKASFKKKMSCTGSHRLHVRHALRSDRPCCIGARSSSERCEGCMCIRRTSPSNAQWRKATSVQRQTGSGGVLRSVDDTCHGSTPNQKLASYGFSLSSAPAVLRPHDRRTSWAEATSQYCRCSFWPGDVRFVVQRPRCYQRCKSGWRHCRIRSMRQQLLPACRNWALDDAEQLLTDVRSVRCSWQSWKNFRLHSWVWNIPARSLISSLLAKPTRDRLSRKWPTTSKRPGRTCTPFWRRFPTVERWSLICGFRSFQGGGRGLRMKRTLFISEASENVCDGP